MTVDLIKLPAREWLDTKAGEDWSRSVNWKGRDGAGRHALIEDHEVDSRCQIAASNWTQGKADYLSVWHIGYRDHNLCTDGAIGFLTPDWADTLADPQGPEPIYTTGSGRNRPEKTPRPSSTSPFRSSGRKHHVV